MSIIPNFLITGILAMLLSLILIVWAVWFVQRRYGGWVQMALAVLLLKPNVPNFWRQVKRS